MSYRHRQTTQNTAATSVTATKPTKDLHYWLQKIIGVLFLLLFIVTPLVFTWFNEELFEFSKMTLVYLLAILIGGCWLIDMIWTKTFTWKRTFLDLPILLFLISQLLSTILSIHPYTSFFGYYTRFNAGFLPILTYVFLFYALVSNLDRAALKKILTASFVVALIISLYGILEHFGHSLSCLIINFGQVLAGKVPFSQAFGVSCWVQLVQERVFATFGQPNWLATYLITLIPLALSLLAINSQKLLATGQKVLTDFQLNTNQRWGLWLTIFAMIIALLWTQSRSGFLGFALSLLVFVIGWLIIFWSDKKALLNKKIIGFFVGVAVIILILGSPYTPSFSELLTRFQPAPETTALVSDQVSAPTNLIDSNIELPTPEVTNSITDSGDIRLVVWKGAIDVWRRYPIFGSGLETFAYSYYLDRPMEHNLVSEWDFLYNKAHNELLNYLATTGIVGLVTYLLIWLIFAWQVGKMIFDKNNSPSDRLLSLGLLAGLVAMMVANFFGFSTVYSNVLWFSFMGFFILLFPNHYHLSHWAGQKKKSTQPLKFNFSLLAQILASCIVGLISLILLVNLVNFWRADYHFARGKTYLRKNAGLNDGLNHLEKAIELSPQESLFYNELADIQAQIAVAYHKQGVTDQAAKYTQAALKTMDHTLALNDRQVNYYKTALRVYLNLAQIDLNYLPQAEQIIDQALLLAPNDAKLRYNQAILAFNTQGFDRGLQLLEELITVYKPNYPEARLFLAQRYEEIANYQGALDNYLYVLKYIDPDNGQALQGIASLATRSALTNHEE